MDIFGLEEADLQTPTNLPKYGFLTGEQGEGLDRLVKHGYGDVVVRFKPAVRGQSTFTLGDSLDLNNGSSSLVAPTGVAEPDENAALYRFGSSTGWWDSEGTESLALYYREPLERFARDPSMETLQGLAGDYVEAQLFGEVDVESVAAVYTTSRAVREKLRTALGKAGLDVELIPGGFIDGRLQHLETGINNYSLWPGMEDFQLMSESRLDQYIEWSNRAVSSLRSQLTRQFGEQPTTREGKLAYLTEVGDRIKAKKVRWVANAVRFKIVPKYQNFFRDILNVDTLVDWVTPEALEELRNA